MAIITLIKWDEIDLEYPWTFFVPIYEIFFGIILFGAEKGYKFVINNIPFLKHPIGIGIMNIYLATVVSNLFNNNDELL